LSPPPALPPVLALEEDESSSPPPHAVSATASPATPAAAMTVRRAGAGAGWSDSLVMLTFPSKMLPLSSARVRRRIPAGGCRCLVDHGYGGRAQPVHATRDRQEIDSTPPGSGHRAGERVGTGR
jgi:hypothetical protein